jgi:hypothetical protein
MAVALGAGELGDTKVGRFMLRPKPDARLLLAAWPSPGMTSVISLATMFR